MRLTFVTALAALFAAVAASPVKSNAKHSAVEQTAGTPIPGQYIVVFKSHVDESSILAHENWLSTMLSSPPRMVDEDGSDEIAATTAYPDFNFLRRYTMEGFKGYAAHIPDILAKSLKNLPEVAYVEQDSVVTLLATQKNPPSWGLSRISSADLPLPKDYQYPDSAGDGVDAYIVDTGCFAKHTDFQGRAKVGASFSNDNNDKDGNGHGTHVAGTVAGSTFGVAKKANLICVKVLNAQGSGTNSDVIAGIEWVGVNAPKTGRPSVANMSLGGGASAALDAAVKAAINVGGVMFAVAAGNSAGDACKLSPARVKEALTVAASDKTDKLASFSERGPCVDIIAPGVDITSSWNNGKENTISGTSMASPHACGVLALAAGQRNFTNPKALKDYVVAIGSRKKITGVPKNTANILLYADVTIDAPEPSPEDPPEKPDPEDPEDPEDPGEVVCPFPKCLIDPSCTSCCFEGVDC